MLFGIFRSAGGAEGAGGDGWAEGAEGEHGAELTYCTKQYLESRELLPGDGCESRHQISQDPNEEPGPPKPERRKSLLLIQI